MLVITNIGCLRNITWFNILTRMSAGINSGDSLLLNNTLIPFSNPLAWPIAVSGIASLLSVAVLATIMWVTFVMALFICSVSRFTTTWLVSRPYASSHHILGLYSAFRINWVTYFLIYLILCTISIRGDCMSPRKLSGLHLSLWTSCTYSYFGRGWIHFVWGNFTSKVWVHFCSALSIFDICRFKLHSLS